MSSTNRTVLNRATTYCGNVVQETLRKVKYPIEGNKSLIRRFGTKVLTQLSHTHSTKSSARKESKVKIGKV